MKNKPGLHEIFCMQVDLSARWVIHKVIQWKEGVFLWKKGFLQSLLR